MVLPNPVISITCGTIRNDSDHQQYESNSLKKKQSLVWVWHPVFDWETSIFKEPMNNSLLTHSCWKKTNIFNQLHTLAFSILAKQISPPASCLCFFSWAYPDLVLKLRWSSSKLRCCCIKRCQPACCSFMVSGLWRWIVVWKIMEVLDVF